ncbi:MAG: four helix bundle protein [Calditrichaeota bacterium]|nr:four helix bundle protein [Calditrichota bacterium]
MEEKIQSFVDLEVWQVAREVRKQIYDITSKLPDSEKYNLFQQMRRAAISVTSNIAEGYGRYHYQENMQFLRMARGSIYELLDHLITCNDQKYITQEDFNQLRNEIITNIKLIDGLIRYLRKTRVGE